MTTRTTLASITLAAALMLGGAQAARAADGYGLLEEYSMAWGDSSAVDLELHDRNLGPGTAQLRLSLQRMEGDRTSLHLEIFRNVPPGALMFALLVGRVELELLGPRDSLVQRVVLDRELGPNDLLTIGDSKGGHFEFERVLERMEALRGVRVRVFGNYE